MAKQYTKHDILQLLRTAPYKNPARIADECVQILRNFKSLSPKQGNQGVDVCFSCATKNLRFPVDGDECLCFQVLRAAQSCSFIWTARFP